ncbi:MAG: NAD(P)H-dependent oxidoreductase [Desulfovibrio sp.]|jgi:hypothetical protein|nr:NAD(P)H-dependent oxidoreductase [Desulfovibrio sp.]
MLIVQCSPRADGVSDAVAGLFAEGAAQAGANILRLPLRQYRVRPCSGCRACLPPPHRCVLARGRDQAEEIFALLLRARVIFVAAPIYFYALPSHFKALVDRSQRFWAAREHGEIHEIRAAAPLVCALTAGRKRGRRLFAGARLTLGCFARVFGFGLETPFLLRGLEEPQELLRRKTVCRSIRDAGRRWGATAHAPEKF